MTRKHLKRKSRNIHTQKLIVQLNNVCHILSSDLKTTGKKCSLGLGGSCFLLVIVLYLALFVSFWASPVCFYDITSKQQTIIPHPPLPPPSDHGLIRASGALGLIVLQRLSWGVTCGADCGCFYLTPDQPEHDGKMPPAATPAFKHLLLVLTGFGLQQHVLRMYSALSSVDVAKQILILIWLAVSAATLLIGRRGGKRRSPALYCAIQSCLWFLTLWTQ